MSFQHSERLGCRVLGRATKATGLGCRVLGRASVSIQFEFDPEKLAPKIETHKEAPAAQSLAQCG